MYREALSLTGAIDKAWGTGTGQTQLPRRWDRVGKHKWAAITMKESGSWLSSSVWVLVAFLICVTNYLTPQRSKGGRFIWAHYLRVQSIMAVMEGTRNIRLLYIYSQETETNGCYCSVLRALDNQLLSNVSASNESAQPLTPEPLGLKTGWNPTPAKFIWDCPWDPKY